MSISNSTKERVGVEVSGPGATYLVLEPKGAKEDPDEGVRVVFSGPEISRVILDPGKELSDPDWFNNLEVKFFRIDEKDVENMREQIAKIQFSDYKYTVSYYQGDIVLGDPESMEIEPYPLLIDLHPPDETLYSIHYQVEVQPHRQHG